MTGKLANYAVGHPLGADQGRGVGGAPLAGRLPSRRGVRFFSSVQVRVGRRIGYPTLQSDGGNKKRSSEENGHAILRSRIRNPMQCIACSM